MNLVDQANLLLRLLAHLRQKLVELLDKVWMPCHLYEVQELVLGLGQLAKQLDHLRRVDEHHHHEEVLQAEQFPGLLIQLAALFVILELLLLIAESLVLSKFCEVGQMRHLRLLLFEHLL